MESSPKKKRDILFMITGIILLFVSLGYTVYAIQFLATHVNEVLQYEGDAPLSVGFNLEALDPLFQNGKLEKLQQ